MKNKQAKPKPGKHFSKPDRKPQQKNFSKKNFLPTILLCIVCLGLYLRTASYDYALDDIIVISDNTYTNKGISGIRKIFSEESFTGYFQKQQDLVAGSRYRPLSIATFAVEMEFFKKPKEDGYGNPVRDASGKQFKSGNPAISHVINALLYSLTILLLYRVLKILFTDSADTKWYLSIPFVTSLLFAAVPLHVEVVANIKGRDEILCLLFSLFTLWCILKTHAKKKSKFIAGAFAGMFLALLSKENALTFLVIVPLTLYYFTSAGRREIFRSVVPLLIATLIYFVMRINAVGFFLSNKEITNLMNNPFYGMNFEQKFATIFYTLGLYIKLLFYPHPLTHDYYPYAIPIMSFSSWKTIVSILVYLLLLWIAISGIRKKSVISYGIIFYLASLSIVSNIVLPVGTFMNDRFVYAASLGFCMALSWLLLKYLPSLNKKLSSPFQKAGAAILILFFLFNVVTTYARIPVWKNNYELEKSDIDVSANSCRANCFWGVALFKKFEQAKNENEKKEYLLLAEKHFKKAIEIYPQYTTAVRMYTGAKAEQFKMDKDVPTLLDAFYKACEVDPQIDFVQEFLNWMNMMGSYNHFLIPFYHQVGFELLYKQKKNYTVAKKYIHKGLELDPASKQLQLDLELISKAESKGFH